MTTELSFARGDPRSVQAPALVSARTLTLLVVAGILVWSFARAGILGGELLNPGGWPIVWRFLRASLHPDVEMLGLAGRATLVTLAYAVCGTALSVVIGAVTGILSSELWWLVVMGRGIRE